jgi:hypothetical protein
MEGSSKCIIWYVTKTIYVEIQENQNSLVIVLALVRIS